MTTASVVGLIVTILLFIGLVVVFISKASIEGYKIQIFIQSSALILTIYQLILKTNAGNSVFGPIILIVVILITLIENIVFLARRK